MSLHAKDRFRSLNGFPSRLGETRVTRVDPPNQALQTTPMTRSIYEKTIEFGHPQRGV